MLFPYMEQLPMPFVQPFDHDFTVLQQQTGPYEQTGNFLTTDTYASSFLYGISNIITMPSIYSMFIGPIYISPSFKVRDARTRSS